MGDHSGTVGVVGFFFFGPQKKWTEKKIFVPRIELGTSRVLGERHNQLDHTNFGVSGFRSQYLVLAKDARFRLRQYPEFEHFFGDRDGVGGTFIRY